MLLLINLGFFCFSLRTLQIDWGIIGGFSLVAWALLLYFVPAVIEIRRLLFPAILVTALIYTRLFWGGTNAFYFENQLLPILKHGNFCQDTAFNCAIAEMIKNYGVPSTGLHGTPYLHYHWGGNAFLAGIAKLLSLPAVVAYPYFITFFAAFMIGSLLLFCAESGNLFQAVLGLACLQLANLHGHIFKCFDLGTSSAVLLGGMAVFLLKAESNCWRRVLICLLVGLSVICKGSVGCFLAVFCGSYWLFNLKKWNLKIITLGLLTAGVWSAMFLVVPPGLGESLKWDLGNQLKEWSGKNSGAELSFGWYYLMPILLVVLGWKKEKLSAEFFFGLFLVLAVFMSLNLTFYNASGLHFVAGAAWCSLLAGNSLRLDMFDHKLSKLCAVGLAIFVIYRAADFLREKVPINWDSIPKTAKRTNAENEIKWLAAQRDNRGDYLIEIPEESLNFWGHWSYDGDSYSGRYFLAFWIPMLSGKPAFNGYNEIIMKNKKVGWYQPGSYGFYSYYNMTKKYKESLKAKTIKSLIE